ncbi:pre-peptidase C-terminal domain-containing protein [Oscillatoria sp. FACHB-1407]|uniref:CARDB domain-containing protein n=1 Tax=Oscillatoria sp. FACHB-1407 TaxID=2692847 RepID=UPI0016844B41|nr:CARDB domain-containing protein [Oscillatoria sp. FACHB-1407]MBD2464732.1 pre-peptidase C-terminal domain-containing protein [Oscillatoria sp. FACHB-1407]
MPVDRIGNTPRQATTIDAGVGFRRYRDQIGGADRNDYFRLNLSDRRSYSISLTPSTADAQLQLLDAAGRVIQRSRRSGRSRKVINTVLEVGTYFIRVFSARRGRVATRYLLGVSATAIPEEPVVDRVGNSSTQASDLGILTGDRTLTEAIGGADPRDYYRFNLTQLSKLTLNLDNRINSVSLLQRDGAAIAGQWTATDTGQQWSWELLPGTYYIQLEAAPAQPNTNYTLAITTTPDRAGSTPNQALDLGTLTQTQTVSNWLGSSNTSDYYRFTLNRDINLSLALNGLGQSVGSIALLDSNDSTLQFATGSGSTASITQDLTAGTYYVQVLGNSDYTLTLNLPAADLVATAFSTPYALSVGSSFTTQFQLQNVGTESVGAFRVNFYLSSDTQITRGDRLLGHYDIAALNANSRTGTLNTVLTLPDANDLFWQTDGTYYIGMAIDPLRAVRETDETNNSNQGITFDQDAVNISGLPNTRPFNIDIDYSSDTIGWFTPQRRAALEAAASIWEKIIQNDLFGAIDLTLNVRADELGGTTAGRAWASSEFNPNASIEFDLSTNWFFDASPNTADDIPANTLDFISVAVHEIGHTLGFSGVDNEFNSRVVNGAFTGINARAYNGGNSIPLSGDGSHIRPGYEFGTSGAPLMNPFVASGTRILPTVLDLAILDDIRFTVNYGAASQNRSNNSASSQPISYAQCGCAACITNLNSDRQSVFSGI